MKKFILAGVIIAAVAVMYIFYQQPFGGGSPDHQSMAQEKTPTHKKKSNNDIMSTYQYAVANAKTAQPQSMEQSQNKGFVPKTLTIPKIKVQANVDQVGLSKDGKVGVPSGTEDVAWYKDGVMPGQKGNAVIDGHVDSYKGPAVFFNLKNLKKNDKVYVVDQNGKKHTFKVVKIESYPTGHAPLQTVFGYTNQPMLNLITCTGTYQQSKGTHDHRLVVYTKLVQ